MKNKYIFDEDIMELLEKIKQTIAKLLADKNILELLEKLKQIDEESDGRSLRERKRHPEHFYKTKYKRPRKGEKYYGRQ